MKAFLAFLVFVLLAALGGGAWLYFQKTDELTQTRTTISGLNDSLVSLQGQLATQQAAVTSLQGQLSTEKTRAAGLESDLKVSRSQNSALQNELDATNARIASLEIEITAANARITSTAEEITAELTRVTTELARANADLIAANSSLATLRAESESEIAELKADIEKLIVPRHFASLEELTAWLSQDDTDTNPVYAPLGLAEKAFILEVKALRDGYLLPASIDADSQHIYSWNIAVIGPSIYVVTASTDAVLFLANFDIAPAQQPLPLPQ